MKQKYSVALIGVGRIGFTLGFDKKREQPACHTMAILKNRKTSLKFACDENESSLSYFKRFNKNVVLFSNTSALFATVKPDIVVIAVNECSHYKVCMQAIRAKVKLIILEKPVALNIDEANELLEASKEYGVDVLVNHERRFANDYKIAKNYMQLIGSILAINARLDSSLFVYATEAEKTGAYSLLHDGTHLIDIVMFLLEDEIGEKVLEHQKISSITYDDETKNVVRTLNVHFENQKCSDVNITFSGKSRFFGFEVDVIGSEGRIRIGNGIFEFYKRVESSLYTGFYSLEIDKNIKKPKKTKYFSNMLQNAVDHLEKGVPLKSTIQTGLNVINVISEIVENIR